MMIFMMFVLVNRAVFESEKIGFDSISRLRFFWELSVNFFHLRWLKDWWNVNDDSFGFGWNFCYRLRTDERYTSYFSRFEIFFFWYRLKIGEQVFLIVIYLYIVGVEIFIGRFYWKGDSCVPKYNILVKKLFERYLDTYIIYF